MIRVYIPVFNIHTFECNLDYHYVIGSAEKWKCDDGIGPSERGKNKG